MTDLLLRTKLNIPRAQGVVVPRPYLVAKLNTGLAKGEPTSGKLFLVAAPAGFGKTSLVMEWLEQLPEGQFVVAWLSLDEADNDLVRFLAYIGGALQQAWPGLDSILPELLKSAQVPALVMVLTLLINEIETIPKQILLVLDDYHLITSRVIHEGIAFLAQNLPDNLSLIVTSRADLPFPVARLRARRQLVEVHAADLRFTADETAVLLNEKMGLTLTSDDIVTLEQRTEGWIVGLQLAALAMGGMSTAEERSQFVRSFSGTHRFVLDYLMEEVLAQQSAETQAFLRRTAILDRLTAPLCDILTDREDSQTVLESLAKANLFLLPQDDERCWYRYHRLFADLLRARGLDDPHRNGMHRRAATWYQENGYTADAFDHWLHAGAPAEAAALVERQAMTFLNQGYTKTILNWIDRLPEDMVIDRPWLSIFQAWGYLLTGRPVDAMNQLQQVAHLATPEMAGHVTAIQGYVTALGGDIITATDLLEKALSQLGDKGIRSVAAFALGGMRLMIGDFLSAESAFLEAAQTGQSAGNRHVAVSAWSAVASLQIAKGKLRQAEEIYQKALALAITSTKRPLPMAAQPYNGLAYLAYERNDLDAALAWLDKGVELVQLWHNPDTTVNTLLMRVIIHLAGGEANDALRDWQEAAHIADNQSLTPLSINRLVATRLEISRVTNDSETGLRLIEEHNLVAVDAVNYAREDELFALIRFLLARDQTDKAEPLLARLINLAKADGRNGSLIKCLALQAVQHEARGETQKAQDTLEHALSLATSEGFIRAFLDAGPLLGKLLLRMKGEGREPRELVDTLLVALVESPIASPSSSTSQPLIEPLTERELEVLGLVAAGLSNRAIADELVVAVGTVKTHVNRIMGKLDAHNRTQAVARARHLNIIP